MSGETVFVIPMAGESSRFRKVGFDKPKFMLPAFRKTVFRFAIESFSRYFESNKFIFIINDDSEVDAFVRREVEVLGITSAEFVQMNRQTDGQAETVALGLEACAIDGNQPISIFNIDSFRLGFSEPDTAELKNADGYLEVFQGEGDHWSFARVESENPTRVIETAEKNRISDYCSNGFYHFKRCQDFLDAYREERENEGGEFLQEFFIAPLYNRLIAKGCDVRIRVIEQSEIKFCGLPTEYRDFLLSGAITEWDAEEIEDPIDIEKLALRDFRLAKEAGQKERAVWVLRTLGVGTDLTTHHLNASARFLEILGRTEDVDSLITMALFSSQRKIDEIMVVAEATYMTGRYAKTLEICTEAKKVYRKSTDALFWGARALDSFHRGDEVSTYIGRDAFLNLPINHLDTLSFILADNGFTRKAKRILQANWLVRPSPSILHGLMKIAAREGHGRARMRLVEDAIGLGIEPRLSDRMHAVAIARRLDIQDTVKILDPEGDLPSHSMPVPSILPAKLKVALCLSGQMRAFEQSAPAIQEFIVDRFDAEVFVSTWNNRGITASAMRDYSRILPRQVARTLSERHSRGRFQERFPRLTAMIDDFEKSPITDKAVSKYHKAIEVNVVDEAQFEEQYFTELALDILSDKKTLKNQMKMFYQINACNELKLKQEARMGARYDMVIRMRPDLHLVGPVVPEVETFGFDVYCDGIKGKGCGDQLCISSSENMDLLSSVWDRANRVTTGDLSAVYHGGGLGIGAHGFFAETIWSHGLAPRLNAKPHGTKLVNNEMYFPDTADAMLRDMSMWPMLEGEDVACIHAIFRVLKENEEWVSLMPDLRALAQEFLPEDAFQKVIS